MNRLYAYVYKVSIGMKNWGRGVVYKRALILGRYHCPVVGPAEDPAFFVCSLYDLKWPFHLSSLV